MERETVSSVPPKGDPTLGDTPVTDGWVKYTNATPVSTSSTPFTDTEMGTLELLETPAAGGVTHSMVLSETSIAGEGMPAKEQEMKGEDMKPVPEIVTTVPPTSGPNSGATDNTATLDRVWNRGREPSANSCPLTVTDTGTAAIPGHAGDTQSTSVAETNVPGTTVTPAASVADPNLQLSSGTLYKPEPITRMSVPPLADP